MLKASELKVGMTVRSEVMTAETRVGQWVTVKDIRKSALMAAGVSFMEIVFDNGVVYMYRVDSLGDSPAWIVREGTPTVEERLTDLERKVNMIFNTINEHFPIHEPGVVIGGGPVEDRLYRASELKRGMIVRRTGGDWAWDRVVRVYGVNINTWRVIFADREPHMFAPGKYDDDPIWEVQRV